jgi:tyrosine-protein kinase Etk/Wzc
MTKDMGILDLALVLAKRRKLIGSITILAAIAAIIYAMLAPFYWKSSATIIPISDDDSIGGLNTNLLSMVGGGLIQTQKGEQAVDFITIMKSRTFRERVINEFDLIEYFEITKPRDHAMELALERLQTKMMQIVFDPESYIISIRAETKDKAMSVAVVNYYLDQLEQYNQQNRLTKGRLKREFLESQVNMHMSDVDSLALALRDFQVQNKSIALEQQTTAMVTMYAETVTKFMQAEIELELAQAQYAESSPLVTELKARHEILTQKLKELENSDARLTPDYLIQIDKVPDLSMQLALLMMNMEIKKTVLEYLYPQYELAKLEEHKDLPSFEVIDQPREAGMRSKPRRAILVIVITMAAFIFSTLLALVVEALFHDADKVRQIWNTLWGKQN